MMQEDITLLFTLEDFDDDDEAREYGLEIV